MKGVVLLDIHSMQIFVSRNVTHHESILPYQSHSSAIPWNYHTNIQSVSDISPAPKTEIVYDVSPLSLDSPPFNPDNISSPPPLPQPFYLNLLYSGLNQLIWKIMCAVYPLNHHHQSTQVFLILSPLFIHFIIYHLHIKLFLLLSHKVLSQKPIKKHVSLIIG